MALTEPRDEILEQTSLEFWYPRICALGIPAPRTAIVKLTDQELDDMQEEGHNYPPTEWSKYVKQEGEN